MTIDQLERSLGYCLHDLSCGPFDSTEPAYASLNAWLISVGGPGTGMEIINGIQSTFIMKVIRDHLGEALISEHALFRELAKIIVKEDNED